MTTFSRTGHYRTNAHGTTFWVSGHEVTRDDGPSWVPRPALGAYKADNLSPASPSRNITIPNARCPVCSAPVYFFMAANGGRVFFDDLGPPWPKHPCTISDQSTVRPFDDPWQISRWQARRRELHGHGRRDDQLALRPGICRGVATIIRRGDDLIAVVDIGGESRAFVVETAWPGRSQQTVFFICSMPETLHYLDPNLSDISIRVLEEIEAPRVLTLDDFAAIVESTLPELHYWISANLQDIPALTPKEEANWLFITFRCLTPLSISCRSLV